LNAHNPKSARSDQQCDYWEIIYRLLIWDYGAVWGFYPAWEEEVTESDKGKGFDSRTMGDLDFILRFSKAWMIDWVDWQQLPSFSVELDKWNGQISKSDQEDLV
jgi:hypothetical protein